MKGVFYILIDICKFVMLNEWDELLRNENFLKL